MAYIGKTNWQNNEIVEPADMNRIEQGITDTDTGLTNHQNNKNNPHEVTVAQIGAETPTGAQTKVNTHANLTNAHSATSTATANRIILRDANGRAKVAAPSASDDIARKDTVDAVQTNLNNHTNAAAPHSGHETPAGAQAKVDAHANRTDNPHSVTKAQVGLGNVDNTSDLNKPISTATQTALDTKADKSTTYTKTEVDTKVNAKADPALSFTGVLENTSWTGTSAPYTKNVTISGISSTGKPPVIDITLSSTWDTALIEEEEWGKIKRIECLDNSLKFYAEEIPSVTLNFKGVQVK